MVFNKLSFNEIKTSFPKNRMLFNIDSKKEEKSYEELYYAYRKLFTEYVINKLDLKKYDDELKNSKCNFKILNDEQMDIYQYFSKDELSFFYIRNNVYIERLNEDEKKFLESIKDKKEYKLDKKAEEFIESTYKKVILEDVGQDMKRYLVLYGPDNGRYLAPNNAIIVGVNYKEFADVALNQETIVKMYKEKTDYIWKLIKKMNEELSSVCDVKVIKYNYASTIKRF